MPRSYSPWRTAPLLALAAGTIWSPSEALGQGSTRTYSKPLAELSEPYTSLRGVRELSDGRLIVTDPRDKVVHLVDMRTNRVTPLAREGSGPNEYQLPMGAFALPGDSTMILDALNSRFLLLGPGGALAGTWSPEASAAPAPPAASSGDGRMRMIAGGGGPMAVINTRAADAAGRLYSEGSGIAMGPSGPQGADSVAVVRSDRRRGGADTVVWVRRPKPTVAASGGNVSVRIGASPFPMQDGWAVLPDGRVAVVRASDYHVEIYPASDRGAVARGAPVRVPTIRVTEAEKQAWRDERAASPGIAIAMTTTSGGGGTTRSTAPVNVAQDDPTEWPAVLPAFQASQVYALPNGDLWVGRYRAASDPNPRYDVFDATGKHTGQVVFPPRTSVVGFGKGVVYTVRRDADDLQYLQRYALQ